MNYYIRRHNGTINSICFYSFINNHSDKTKELKEKYLSANDWYFSQQLNN